MQHVMIECTNGIHPEDVVALTALMRDVNYKCRDYFRFSLVSNNKAVLPEMLENNPNIAELQSGAKVLKFTGIKPSEERHHFDGLPKWFQDHTMISFLFQNFHGELFLTEQEKKENPVKSDNYILVGVDKKFHWPYWSEIAKKNPTRDVVCVGLEKVEIDGVINKTGELTLREIVQHVYHSGTVGTTCRFIQSVAGALEKPCTYLVGGRESLTWRQFSCCRMLGGQEGICQKQPCWSDGCFELHCLNSIDVEKVNNCLHSFERPTIDRFGKCKYAKLIDEQWHEARPCKGCKVECQNPKCPIDIWYVAGCNPRKCKFYEGS